MNKPRRITAQYNAANGNWSFSGPLDTSQNDSIYCATGPTLVSFTLVTINSTSGNATFTGSPFTWVVAPGAPNPPKCISNISYGSLQSSFVDDNSAPGSYEVLLNATYNNSSIQSPDPTLINEGTAQPVG